MKKLTLVLVFISFITKAQQKQPSNIMLDELKAYENTKSGNYKDVLASFFQLALTNFSGEGEEKAIGLNTTLFELKAKANPKLLEGYNYADERFSRNFQFNFKLNLDDNYSYKGFTGGITLAVLNKRDRALAVFTKSEYGKLHEEFISKIDSIRTKLNGFDTENPLNEVELKLLDETVSNILNNKDSLHKDDNKYYDLIAQEFEMMAKADKNFDKRDIAIYMSHLKNLRNDAYAEIDAKPLWTIAIDGSAIEKGKFNKASFETIFLKGVKNTLSEIDIRAKLVYADTITTTPMPRMNFNAKAGINFKLGKGANDVSYFETKIAMEYNNILKNILPSEKKTNFLANAEVRVRLADDLWLPLIIKYDIENANFLGFLNLSYNFGSFTSNTKPKKQ